MFKEYRNRMSSKGCNINQYFRQNSQNILDDNFTSSTSYKRVIVEGKEYDARIITDSKTTIRSGAGNYTIHFKGGIKFKAGTYVDIPYEKGRMVRWMLIYEDDDPFFDKPIIKKCNYLLKWKNEYGDIIERNVVFNDNIRLAPNIAEVQRGKGLLPSHTKIFVLPLDVETLNIKRGDRFLVDFDIGLRHEPASFTVINRNVTSKVSDPKAFNGVVELSIVEGQFNPKTDNAELMVADYYKDTDVKNEDIEIPPVEREAKIQYKGKSDLIMGMNYKEYSAKFYMNNVEVDNITPVWNVTLNQEFKENFDYKIENNKVYIKCNYSPLLINSNCKITLQDENNLYKTDLIVKVVSAI